MEVPPLGPDASSGQGRRSSWRRIAGRVKFRPPPYCTKGQ